MGNNQKANQVNKKLAEWAGFRTYLQMGNGSYYGVYEPNGDIKVADFPDFTNSLDACFKWLVPKIWSLNCIIFDQSGAMICQHEVAESSAKDTLGEAEPYSLALCLAIEKLIDREVE